MSAPFISLSPEETQDLGKVLGALTESGDIILLTGDLGAGKTQFTKGVAQALGVAKPITSPTFNLILEYQDEKTGRILLRHFDLYRLDKAEELDDIDYFGLLEDDTISVVEWGDKFSEALPLDYLLIDFEFIDDNTRAIRFEATGGRSGALLKDMAGAIERVKDGR